MNQNNTIGGEACDAKLLWLTECKANPEQGERSLFPGRRGREEFRGNDIPFCQLWDAKHLPTPWNRVWPVFPLTVMML